MAEGWWFIVCYVIAAVAYFAYELITTKRFYNLLRALPGFVIGIVLNALLVGLMYLTASHVLSVQPLPQEVQSVRLVSQGMPPPAAAVQRSATPFSFASVTSSS